MFNRAVERIGSLIAQRAANLFPNNGSTSNHHSSTGHTLKHMGDLKSPATCDVPQPPQYHAALLRFASKCHIFNSLWHTENNLSGRSDPPLLRTYCSSKPQLSSLHALQPANTAIKQMAKSQTHFRSIFRCGWMARDSDHFFACTT